MIGSLFAIALQASVADATLPDARSYMNCMGREVEKLDDRVSDAHTIAKAIRDVCGVEYETFLAKVATQRGHPDDSVFKADLRKSVEPVFQAFALHIVLVSRRAPKAAS